MDSRLLNVVYDDPFDGNYVKYDHATDFWSSETIGMQLTETLDGILPIAPTEDFHKDEHSPAINIQNSKNAFYYEGFTSHDLTTSEDIDILKVDQNIDGYDTDCENEEVSDDGDNADKDLLDFDRQSQHSNATFRTRTDSSSIGDYESHTSDYEDDDSGGSSVNNTDLIDDERSNKDNNSILDLHSNFVTPDDLVSGISYEKSSTTLSTHNLNSDVDGLGLQIDANNFDLAEFITKDDFQVHNVSSHSNKSYAAPKMTVNILRPAPAVQAITYNQYDSDSDSDIIVDVETIEMDEDETSCLRKASEMLKSTSALQVPNKTEEDIAFVDNVKSDPSWSPTSNLKKMDKLEKYSTQKPNFTHTFPLVPNKKQSDLLKGKFAKGKGKNSQKPIKATAGKTMKTENSPLTQPSIATTSNSIVKHEDSSRKIGIEMKVNNSISDSNFDDNKIRIKNQIVQCGPQQQKPVTVNRKILEETPAKKAQAVKRKLNLEEYKRRRGGELIATTTTTNTPLSNVKLSNKIPKFENKKICSLKTNDDRKSAVNITHTKRSETVTSIVKTLKEQQGSAGKTITDPITIAKNKVLRMQELKKAQQMRIIDSTICSKLPRVTKLLPLKDIVKETPNIIDEEKKSLNSQTTKSDYDEIIIVSTSCNTDVSIPPIPNPVIHLVNNATRSLLKSSALLTTITNTFQKVKSIDNTKLSTSSLIASIKDVVVKKTLPVEVTVIGGDMTGAEKPEHHGEDKIIMHLRKDRIRKRMCSIGIQTDSQLEFPPLTLLKSSVLHRSRERTRGYRKRQYRKHNDLSWSSSSEFSSDGQSEYSKSPPVSRSRCSSSLERIRTYDSAIGTGGYSSRSSFKYRSSISSSYSESADHTDRGRRQRRTSYTKRCAARKHSRSPYSSSSYSSDSDGSRGPPYRRSRSRSNSHSRSRSRRSRYRKGRNKTNNFADRNVPEPAVEERRIVYVGRIEEETTKDMLRRKFLKYGIIKQISIHFKDTGMKYGFVTFERSQDAFAAIDKSTRDPQINMYDVSFGGRRAFCRSSYADLDNAGINTYHSYVFPQAVQQPKEEDSFEALLMKMKEKLKANKTSTTNSSASTATNSQSKSNNKI